MDIGRLTTRLLPRHARRHSAPRIGTLARELVMLSRSRIPLAFLLTIAAAPAHSRLVAQVEDDRGPRFLLASARQPVPLDVARTPILRHRLSLNLESATIADALSAISAQTGLRFVYSREALPARARVR